MNGNIYNSIQCFKNKINYLPHNNFLDELNEKWIFSNSSSNSSSNSNS